MHESHHGERERGPSFYLFGALLSQLNLQMCQRRNGKEIFVFGFDIGLPGKAACISLGARCKGEANFPCFSLSGPCTSLFTLNKQQQIRWQ